MWNLGQLIGGKSWHQSATISTNGEPLRGELLSVDLLKQFARNLAENRRVENGGGANLLLSRLASNEKVLRDYNERTLRVEKTRRITPGAEWLLDNFPLLEEQIRTARRHLPHGFNRQLPQLLTGPWANYPRVYEIALEIVSHTDGRIDSSHLTAFITGYQGFTPLRLSELWALPIMLRLALIENLRRVSVQLSADREARDVAAGWVGKILHVAEVNPSQMIVVVGQMAQSEPSLDRAFVTEFLRLIQEKSTAVKLAVSWMEERLAEAGLTTAALVQSESQYQAAAQASIGNSIGSLRFIDLLDWRDFVEGQSVVEKLLRDDPAGVYARMDFGTRDLYRHVVERLARHSDQTEPEIAACAVDLARQNAGKADDRRAHVGFFLAGKGIQELERAAKVSVPLREVLPRLARKSPLTFYLGSILTITLLVTLELLAHVKGLALPIGAQIAVAAAAALGASQFAVLMVNWLVTRFIPPATLPRMDFSKGIPAADATLVVVPTMLASSQGVESLLESLEVRYLANRDNHLFFALLTDFRDAPQATMPGDEELLELAVAGITALNEKYQGDRPGIFFLFHRPRRWNEAERIWMGYERKRGKLSDLNHWLRGGGEPFSKIAGDPAALPRIKFVITLDTDTQLPREAARQLAATLAHPLNLPVYDAAKGRVVEGYSILQPRVAISLPTANQSWFVKIFSGEPGIDPYTRTVSDVYQDVFGEGSFIGKGIYDVDAFEQALGGRFPENRILSHDLLEGSYARSGLVSDVQLFEEFPSRYSADTRRRHRWMRGDWQIAAWLLPRLPGPGLLRVPNPLTGLSRWKIFDNLRRSLVPGAMVFLFLLGWIIFATGGAPWTPLLLALLVVPALLAVITEFFERPADLPYHLHARNVGENLVRQAGQTILWIAFLPYDAVIGLDAIVRTLWRLGFSRRNLLEWQTAGEVAREDQGTLSGFLGSMIGASLLAIGALGLMAYLGMAPSWLASGILGLWLISPVVAWWISRPLTEKPAAVSPADIDKLHRLARRVWNFFETFVTAEEHWLPPDNFQEYPHPVIATRTSPTNMGLSLLCALGAHDFGYLPLGRLTGLLAQMLETLEKLERHRGHFYNWYDTRTLKPMAPLYISTVDNGNLAGLLLTLHSGLLEKVDEKWSAGVIISGLRDTLGVLKEQGDGENQELIAGLERLLAEEPGSPAEMLRLLDAAIESVGKSGNPGDRPAGEFERWRLILDQSCREQRGELLSCHSWLRVRAKLDAWMEPADAKRWAAFWDELNAPASPRQWAGATDARLSKLEQLVAATWTSPKSADLELHLAELRHLLAEAGLHAQDCVSKLEALARRCDVMARMDFTLLYEPERELFSIGYNVTQHRLDSSCYDLLASEARLGSYVAIALGQIPQNHWFRLGRSLTSTGGKPTLISWSGSMFEYLMPLLVMPSYANTLLDMSCKSAVERQIQYGRQLRVPWGMSESGYNLRDASANYQYRAFGVPGLGFKRGLAHDVVVAPYATVMALMVAPEESCKNLDVLRRENASGSFGFYEALDYTAARVPSGATHAVVRSFMAHHQGMSFLSLASALLDRPMQRRFDANLLFKSAELLLHERVPRQASVLHPHELEVSREHETPAAEATLRIFTDPDASRPEVHLLSNGRYHVMVTAAGSGYSRWNDTSLTRWREDSACDGWGTFFYLRDVESGAFWSPAHQPTLESKPGYEAIFSQGRAEFRSRLFDLEAHIEISVSPENDVEVRRLTLTNHSDETRLVEVTTYAEIVLNSAAADLAHPAFSNLFIQTQIIPEQNALLFTRRSRASHETLPWIGQVLLISGAEAGNVSFETDRSKFIGRAGTLTDPAALRESAPLSNSEGAVLDPIASIRRTLRLAPQGSAKVTLVSGIGPTREEITRIVEKYQDQSIADRCFELAWTHGLMMLRHLNITEVEAQLYGRLAGALIYSQAIRRAAPNVILRNQRGQQNLWSFGISGDLPIVLLYVLDLAQLGFVGQMVQAHSYWRLKGLAADLVILNEDDSVYRQALHDQILNVIGANGVSQLIDKPGGIFPRRLDQFSPDDRILLEAAARIVLHGEKGTLAEQLARRVWVEALPPPLRVRPRARIETTAAAPRDNLLFFNGVGGFSPDGREYVIRLPAGAATPAPWVNVLANPNFGTLISESGGAYTWSENCHEFRLTPWNNDAVTDASGEALYIRDEETGRFWSPTPLPARGNSPYAVRHGFGYSVFEHEHDGIACELWIYVSIHEPVKFAVLKLRNNSGLRRHLSVTSYWEWVLGETRQKNAMHVTTELDSQSPALFARNSYNNDFAGRVAFVGCTELARSVTGDRAEFLGRNGTLRRPAALRRARLSGKTGAGLDPCAALQAPIEMEPDQDREIVFILGAGQNLAQARDLARRFQTREAASEELQKVRDFWGHTLGAVQVETPEPALNLLANGWLLYQTISCRLWARTGFYQSGGAFGFRDQLQDAMTLVFTRRELLREQLLRAAARQFREGDVQHWWHPPTGRGVRTHFSDDFLWLPYATCRYVEAVGDTGVLDSEVAFLEGRALRPEEEANYELPNVSGESGTLYEHCVRAIRNGLKFGGHGLPLMGCGDWNDGMNLVGAKGKGESIWLAFFLGDVLKRFSALAARRGDQAFAQFCETQVGILRENIEKNAWDGQWYLRAYFDNGEPLGSASNPECQIDALPQAWAVLSGLGGQERSRTALAAVAQRLVRTDAKLIQLFDPPFDKSAMDPGYIRGYVPGVRENGGQYTHAAVWTVMAFAQIGDTATAWNLFKLINPILRSQKPEMAAGYKVEPYVIAADVYSVPPHAGRGGWTWYTGSAGWMYRLIVETLLGMELIVDEVRFTPKVPSSWKSFKLDFRHRETMYHITCRNVSGKWSGPPKVVIDGELQKEGVLRLANDRRDHVAELSFDR